MHLAALGSGRRRGRDRCLPPGPMGRARTWNAPALPKKRPEKVARRSQIRGPHRTNRLGRWKPSERRNPGVVDRTQRGGVGHGDRFVFVAGRDDHGGVRGAENPAIPRSIQGERIQAPLRKTEGQTVDCGQGAAPTRNRTAGPTAYPRLTGEVRPSVAASKRDRPRLPVSSPLSPSLGPKVRPRLAPPRPLG